MSCGKARKILAATAIATGIIAADEARAAPTLDQNGRNMVLRILDYDLVRYAVEGPYSAVEWEKLIPVEQDIAATDLGDAYHKNGLAADNKYLNKKLIVWGRVSAIGRDPLGQPYVSFETEQMFQPVVARLAPIAVAPISELAAGNDLSLYCRGAGFEIISPIVKDCVTMDQMVDQFAGEVDTRLNKWFRGGTLDFPWRASENVTAANAAIWLIGWYAAGAKLPPNSPCLRHTIGQDFEEICIKPVHAGVPSRKDYGTDAEFTALYDSLTDYLHLPKLGGKSN